MLERLEMSDGLGAIYPGIMNSIIALRCLGYSLDDPQVIRAMDEFEKLGIEEETTFRMQPCMSPVWDTAYAVFALGESGVAATDPRLVQPCEWMLKKQVTRRGDWCVKNRKAAPAGWYFEFNNEFYPDVDDTAQVLLALSRVKTIERELSRQVGAARAWTGCCRCSARTAAGRRSTRTTTAWCSSRFRLPTTTPCSIRRQWTSRAACWSAWRRYGYSLKDEPVRRAIEFIKREQEPDGSWFGRWGVNYIYGTMLVLRGLEAIGVDHHEPCVQQAAEWLRMMQNPDGGWGETLRFVRRSQHQGRRAEHGFANRVGGHGTAGGQRYPQRFAAARHRLSAEDAAARRIVG